MNNDKRPPRTDVEILKEEVEHLRGINKSNQEWMKRQAEEIDNLKRELKIAEGGYELLHKMYLKRIEKTEKDELKPDIHRYLVLHDGVGWLEYDVVQQLRKGDIKIIRDGNTGDVKYSEVVK